jgi:hypothetical protein
MAACHPWYSWWRWMVWHFRRHSLEDNNCTQCGVFAAFTVLLWRFSLQSHRYRMCKNSKNCGTQISANNVPSSFPFPFLSFYFWWCVLWWLLNTWWDCTALFEERHSYSLCNICNSFIYITFNCCCRDLSASS